MTHILTIFGTRPEAIKLAPVIKALEDRSDLFRSSVCVTGQHREMLDQVLPVFEIQPNHDLHIMKPNQDLSEITSEVLLKLKGSWKMSNRISFWVQGDTTTTFAAALPLFTRR